MPNTQTPHPYDPTSFRSRNAGTVRLVAIFLCLVAVGGLAGVLIMAADYLPPDTRSMTKAQIDRLEQPTGIPSSPNPVQNEIVLPTPSPTNEPTLEPTPLPDGCVGWASVTLNDVGKEMCIQGSFIREYTREDGTNIMIFSEEPGTFQVWSSSKPFSWYLGGKNQNCVFLRGWILTSGVRPILILGSKGKIETCQ